MICFDVYLNNEKLCRAGMEEALVLNCILDWAKRPPEGGDEMNLHVGGLYKHESGGKPHPRWVENLSRNEGDEITIRVVESNVADAPINKTVETAEDIERHKRRYFEAVKAEIEASKD